MARKDKHAPPSQDAAGVGPYARPNAHLVPMKQLGGWKIADSDADIRGWTVRTVSGREIGEVEDLLVDHELGEVVLIDIDLKDSSRHSFAPIRAAQIDRARRMVLLDTADLREDEPLPGLSRPGVTDDEARTFGTDYNRLYGKRAWAPDRDYVVSGDDHDIHFNRRPLTDAADAATSADRRADLPERRAAGTARVPEGTTEETVIERRPVVVEEVIVRRRVVSADSPEARARE